MMVRRRWDLPNGIGMNELGKLDIDDKLFDHDEYWKKIRKPTGTNRRMSLIQEPLMRVMHRLIVGALVHRLGRIKENSLIYGGHYVTKIAKSLGYLVKEEVEKCSEPIECEKWTTKMLVNELDLENYTLLRPTLSPPLTRVPREQRQEPSSMPSFRGTSIVPSSGYEVGGSSRSIQDEDDEDASMSEQIVHTNDDIGSQED
ncbi:hypothetical protein Tco_0838924 [Tanacetum coccineum]|uniref:Uncharacterized protein n=1 Tax=Tanacetum coccineum TaxID=301880 RepID=A0ABQ5AS17_9ASTR